MAGGSGATVPAPADAARPGRWPDLRKRVVSAAILLPAALLALWLGGVAWTALVLAALAGLAWEWVRLCGFDWRRPPGLAVPVIVLLAAGLGLSGTWPAAAVGLFAGALGLALRHRWLSFGVLYLGAAGLALLALRAGPAGGGAVLFLLVIVWASDIGAYFAGRFLGGPKLAPRISPNKTWSGAAGGLVAAMLAGLAVAEALAPASLAATRVLPVAALLGLASQSGDLFESWIKRHYGVKDSSSLIPGHGGLLDRLDGVLAAAPVAALLAAGGAFWR
jgi:phosphatidate cytidylyltransferase